jgi:hypothetical protein
MIARLEYSALLYLLVWINGVIVGVAGVALFLWCVVANAKRAARLEED